MVKVEHPLLGLLSLLLREIPVERVLRQGDDLLGGAIALVHLLNDPLAHGGLEERERKINSWRGLGDGLHDTPCHWQCRPPRQ